MIHGPAGPARFDAADADTALAQFILSLRARGVVDRALLIAFETTPRVAFLPRHNPSLMYAPHPLPIDCGAEATAPTVIAQLLGALALKPGMKVLDIGTGSGFQAAVLARFGCQVTTIERFETLHLAAARAMQRQKIVNVRLEHGDGRDGLADGAPYDRIIVNGAMRDVPDALVEQLAPGGTLVAPMMLGREQRLYAFDDAGDAFRQRDLGRVSFQMLLDGRARAL